MDFGEAETKLIIIFLLMGFVMFCEVWCRGVLRVGTMIYELWVWEIALFCFGPFLKQFLSSLYLHS